MDDNLTNILSATYTIDLFFALAIGTRRQNRLREKMFENINLEEFYLCYQYFLGPCSNPILQMLKKTKYDLFDYLIDKHIKSVRNNIIRFISDELRKRNITLNQLFVSEVLDLKYCSRWLKNIIDENNDVLRKNVSLTSLITSIEDALKHKTEHERLRTSAVKKFYDNFLESTNIIQKIQVNAIFRFLKTNIVSHDLQLSKFYLHNIQPEDLRILYIIGRKKTFENNVSGGLSGAIETAWSEIPKDSDEIPVEKRIQESHVGNLFKYSVRKMLSKLSKSQIDNQLKLFDVKVDPKEGPIWSIISKLDDKLVNLIEFEPPDYTTLRKLSDDRLKAELKKYNIPINEPFNDFDAIKQIIQIKLTDEEIKKIRLKSRTELEKMNQTTLINVFFILSKDVQSDLLPNPEDASVKEMVDFILQ